MRTLYHFALSPFSRKVRLFLHEKDLDFELISENFWERRRDFMAMNPAAQVPVLVENDNSSYSESTAICEYLEEIYPDRPLIGRDPHERAETRRIAGWFNNKFYYEVTKYLLDEKVIRYYKKEGPPRSRALKAGKENIKYHLEYIAHLTKKHRWLTGDEFTLADITAAAHLSVLDYLGDVPWTEFRGAKEWYALVKSRPSFRSLLADNAPGFKPSLNYANLDF
jgi:glutathione S-transferase